MAINVCTDPAIAKIKEYASTPCLMGIQEKQLLIALALKISALSLGGGGVTTFNTRSGAVTLSSADVTDALTFTPENVANKATNLTSPNNTKYPTTLAVSTALGLKQDSLGYTAFNKAGDSVSGTGGAGYIGLIDQSAAPSAPVNGLRLFSDASHRFSWIGQNGFIRTFDGTANTADRVYTLPDAAGTVVLNTNTATLTNKRVTPRVNTETSSATSTPTGDSSDAWTITALAAADAIAAPTGTPTDMQSLIIRIKDDGNARALTFNAIYRAGDIALPTTTVAGKTMYLGFRYNAADTKWDFLGSVGNF